MEKIAIFGNPVDLTEGSSQLELLHAIIEDNGVTVLLEMPDPSGNFLSLEWDEVGGRYQLVWMELGNLKSSRDLETWTNPEEDHAPYTVESDSSDPEFWRLERSF